MSYVGYATQTVTASSNLVVTLVEDSKVLNDVVVIGYGRAKKSDLTGSVTAIKPDEKNHGLQTNAQDMIQGKIAGVNITTSSGQPGSGATIRIRGGSSFNDSGNDPLIVIDGLAMDNQGVKGLSNPLSMVNPNDIESFTVLKDASATAIYGSRGSNGVIIITTKKGRKDMAPKVSYNGNVSASIVKKYTNVLDGNQYRELRRRLCTLQPAGQREHRLAEADLPHCHQPRPQRDRTRWLQERSLSSECRLHRPERYLEDF